MTPRRPAAWMFAAVGAWAFLFAWPTRSGDFLRGDDHGLVLEQVFVNHPTWPHAWRLLTMVHGDLYQPLPMLTFQANYALAGPHPTGKFAVDPFVFHLTNILLHACNSMLAAAIALRLSGCARVALLGGAMFACHPLAQEPVAWITGRMILLASLFSMLLILIVLRRRADARGGWSAAAVAAWVAALLSKVLPSVPVAAAWCEWHAGGAAQDGHASPAVRRRFPRRWWATYALLMVLAAGGAYLAVQSTRQIGLIEITQAEMTTSAPVRMLLASRYYFENYVWPTRMSAWSPPPDRVPFLSMSAGIAVAEWAALLLIGAMAWRRARLVTVGIGLFVILIAPFLAATAARNFLTADRYMYLPMLGLHLAVAAGAVGGLNALARRIGSATARAMIALPALCVLLLWTREGWRQAAVWSSTLAQGLRACEVYPDDPRVRAELARAYTAEGQPERALEVVAEARRRWPDEPRIAAQAGEAFRELGLWEDAARELARAVEGMPDSHRARYYLGLTCERLGRMADARACYEAVLRDRADYLPAITALARNYRAEGRADEAIAAFERAIAVNRYHRDSLYELALLMIRRDAWPRAAELLATIVDFDPDDAEAALNLGVACARLGRGDEAIALYGRILHRDPRAHTARLNRAELLAAAGRPGEAEADWKRVLLDAPGHRDAAIGLHGLLQDVRPADLVRLWQEVRAAPDRPADVEAWLAWSLVLADQLEEAEALIEGMPADAPGRALADWARVLARLRHYPGRAASPTRSPESLVVSDAPPSEATYRALMEALDAPSLAPAGAPSRDAREQGPLVRRALAALPDAVRQSAAGLHVAARALAFEGDSVRAAALARAALEAPDAALWRERTLSLLDTLK